jgi:hypothetical protein
MSQANSASVGLRILAWVSWLSLAVAVLAGATALFCLWGVNAESFGARDMGLALNFSIVGAVTMVGLFYAVPVLAVLGVLSLFLQRHAGFRFLAAGAIAALPFVVLTWLEGA